MLPPRRRGALCHLCRRSGVAGAWGGGGARCRGPCTGLQGAASPLWCTCRLPAARQDSKSCRCLDPLCLFQPFPPRPPQAMQRAVHNHSRAVRLPAHQYFGECSAPPRSAARAAPACQAGWRCLGARVSCRRHARAGSPPPCACAEQPGFCCEPATRSHTQSALSLPADMRRVRGATEELCQELGRQPSCAAIAQRCGFTLRCAGALASVWGACHCADACQHSRGGHVVQACPAAAARRPPAWLLACRCASSDERQHKHTSLRCLPRPAGTLCTSSAPCRSCAAQRPQRRCSRARRRAPPPPQTW